MPTDRAVSLMRDRMTGMEPPPPMDEPNPLESDELEPEAVKSADGRYVVHLEVGCAVCESTTGVVLDPSDARHLAYQLTKAAEEAEEAEAAARKADG
jgi:hypothetical protein